MDAPQSTDLITFAENYNMGGAVPQPPPKASKGNSFDFGSIVVQSDEDFARLPDSQKQLLRNMKQGIQYTPQAAAEFVETFNTRLIEQSTPKAQAEASAAQLSARKTQLDIGKLEQETIAKAKEQAEIDVRKQLVLGKIEKFTNPKAQGYTPMDGLVGKWDGSAGAMIDSGGWNDAKAAQRAELERLVNNDVLELTKFLKPVSQDELKFLKSMTPRLHQNDTIWKDYLLDAKTRIEGAGQPAPSQAPTQPAAQPNSAAAFHQAPPQAAPAQPAAPQSRVIRGQRFVQLPNGNWIPQ
jgi:hypothetical protein